MSSSRFRAMPFIAGGLALVLLGAVLGAAGAIAWLSADAHRAQLVDEMSTIPQYTGAQLTNETASSKFGQASVERSYVPQAAFAALHAFYDNVLSQRGWKAGRLVRFSDGDSACYTRADDSALLTVLDNPSATWAWTFSLNWGNAGC